MSTVRDSDKFLTPHEAADFLAGVNPRTIRRWAREGYLPAYPIGEGKRRLWRFRRSDLEGWLVARRTGGELIDSGVGRSTIEASHRCSERTL